MKKQARLENGSKCKKPVLLESVKDGVRDLTEVVPDGHRPGACHPHTEAAPHRQSSKDVHVLARNLLNYTNSFQQRLTGHRETRK